MFTGSSDVKCLQKICQKKLGFTSGFSVCSLFHKVYYLLDSIRLIDLDRDSKVTQRAKK